MFTFSAVPRTRASSCISFGKSANLIWTLLGIEGKSHKNGVLRSKTEPPVFFIWKFYFRIPDWRDRQQSRNFENSKSRYWQNFIGYVFIFDAEFEFNNFLTCKCFRKVLIWRRFWQLFSNGRNPEVWTEESQKIDCHLIRSNVWGEPSNANLSFFKVNNWK